MKEDYLVSHTVLIESLAEYWLAHSKGLLLATTGIAAITDSGQGAMRPLARVFMRHARHHNSL